MDTSMNLSESRQHEILVVAWTMTGLAIFTVAIKLFARAQIVRVIGWDDIFIVFSLILSIVASAFVHYGVHLGFGRHTAVVVAEYGEERLFMTAKFQMLGYPFNIAAFSFPNISIVILVCQLLDPKPLRTKFLYGMTILQVIFAMITIVLAFAQCRPARKLWEKNLPGQCWDPKILNNFSYFFCAYTALTDLVLAVVPIVVFWDLQMKKSTKIGLCVLVGMTMLSAIATIVKGTYLHLFTDTTDPLINPVPLVLWGLVEQNIVIMAACVPTMRPLFYRSWNRGATSDNTGSRPWSADQLTALSLGRNNVGHERMSSTTDVALEALEKDDMESGTSHQGIMRTFKVSIESDRISGMERRDERTNKNSAQTLTGDQQRHLGYKPQRY